MTTPNLLKIKYFEIRVMKNKNFSRDSNYIVEVVMGPKFGNCNVSMGEVLIASIISI